MDEKQPKVLLIEDNRIAQIAAKVNLAEVGCKVDLASTSREAILLAEEKEYDIIFMDIGLDEIEGFEITRIIKERKGKNSSTPIIALTAHGENLYKDRALEVGMNDFLIKPLAPENIKHIINKYFVKS